MTMLMIAVAAVAVIGLFLGLVIGFAAKKFAVEIDPRIEKVLELLPSANCGGCGYAGCADFAKAVVTDGADPSSCAAAPAESAAKIAEIVGRAASGKEKMVAVIYCSGDNSKALKNARYNGLNDCRAAAVLAGGGKACPFGCIGLASCARTCPFHAIEVRNGLAIVHSDLCTGCGKCVSVCPRKLIALVPARSKAHIYCNSLDKGPVKMKYCRTACLSCKKCVKAEPGKFNAQGFLVRCVDPDVDPGFADAVNCPTRAFQSVEAHTSGAKVCKENKIS